MERHQQLQPLPFFNKVGNIAILTDINEKKSLGINGLKMGEENRASQELLLGFLLV